MEMTNCAGCGALVSERALDACRPCMVCVRDAEIDELRATVDRLTGESLGHQLAADVLKQAVELARQEIVRLRMPGDVRSTVREALRVYHECVPQVQHDAEKALDWLERRPAESMPGTEPPAVLALRNVRSLAMRLRETDPVNAAHFLWFCASAGVVGNVLRGESGGSAE